MASRALADRDEEALRPLLDDLVRKELLYLDTDPFSPERGQYGFLQALVQRVAYETLSRRDRKAKHLAAARHLIETAGIEPDEIAEVIATHYLDALGADESADDAPAIRASARGWLERAADRATSLAAPDEAQRAYESAAALADEPSEHAQLLERAGGMARMGNRMNDAERHFTRARELYLETGDVRAAARSAAGLSHAVQHSGRTEEAIRLAEEAYAVLGAEAPDRDTARLAAELARLHFFFGDYDAGRERIEAALQIAERTKDMALLASALNTKSMLWSIDRPHESYALVKSALEIALDHDLVFEALRAYNNLAVQLEVLDRNEETMPLMEEALEFARRRGDRQWIDVLIAATVMELIAAGRWDEAEELTQDHHPLTVDVGSVQMYADLLGLSWQRGDEAATARWLARAASASGDEGDRQRRQVLLTLRRTTLAAQGSFDEALAVTQTEILDQLENMEQNILVAHGLRAAASLVLFANDQSPAERVLDAVKTFYEDDTPRAVTAQLARLDGVLASLRGEHDDAAERFGIALAAARSLGYVPWVAEILVDYAASLVADERPRGCGAAARRGARDRRAAALGAPSHADRGARASGARREGARVSCASCGAENRSGRKFCSRVRRVARCRLPACGAGERAWRASSAASAGRSSRRSRYRRADPERPRAPAVAERRLVSILFADLVGYTAALREPRLRGRRVSCKHATSSTARTVIERYGGRSRSSSATRSWPSGVRRSRARTTPSARCERRSSSLTPSPPSARQARPISSLRAGVLTGEAAVSLGAEGQGMVTGDLVNTASRIQAAATPGTVLVGDSTRRATEASVAYQAAASAS